MTGGIENVCKNICYYYHQQHQKKLITFNMVSLYDDLPDEKYIHPKLFKGYFGKKVISFISSINLGLKQDLVVLSHINLSLIGLIIKILSPQTKLILWTHGIEIWRPISFIKKTFLKKVNQIVAVSHFTAQSLAKWHQVDLNRVKVTPNSLDPLYQFPTLVDTRAKVKAKYHLEGDLPIFMAVCRIKSSEKNKNYDQVISALAQLKKEGKPSYYFLCGKYEAIELERLKTLAKTEGFADHLIMPGHVNQSDLLDLQLAANTFVLPSSKEGFGLVFIESQAAGLRVLAGNQDGSTEAVTNKISGCLINPSNLNALTDQLRAYIHHPASHEEKVAIQHHCQNNFSYARFAQQLNQISTI